VSIFEVVFNLVGLVLGLALVEVLSGLAKLMKRRDSLNVGWVTPLLGVWIMADVTQFWGQAYEMGSLLPSVWPSLGVALAITSIYYLAASLVIPDTIEDQAAYDHAYWQSKRLVFGLVLSCNVATWLIGLGLGRRWTPEVTAINLCYAATMIAVLILPGRRTNIALLSALIANQVWAFATP
jgi:hypothetical protein